MALDLSSLSGLPTTFVLMLVFAIVLAIMWSRRNQVYFLITGDDKFRFSKVDCVAWLVRHICCLCGPWTSYVTGGKSVQDMFIGAAGIHATTCRVRNIIVGDLPSDKPMDWYISVECSTYPTQHSSVEENVMGKVIHFPDVLTLKLRSTNLEVPVKITVYEMGVALQTAMCSTKISPEALLDLASNAEGNRVRFGMDILLSDIPLGFPAKPWISFEVVKLADTHNFVSDVEQLQPSYFSSYAKVRVSEPASRAISTDREGQASPRGAASALGGLFSSERSSTRTKLVQPTDFKDMDMGEFKKKFPLLDASGRAGFSELPDDEVSGIQDFYCLLTCASHTCFVVYGLFLALWGAFRGYLWSCWRQFKWITVAQHQNRTMPMTTGELAQSWTDCQSSIKGLSLRAMDPDDPRRACLPEDEEVLHHCQDLPAMMRPRAFVGLAADLHEESNGFVPSSVAGRGLPCFEGCCEVRQLMKPFDVLFIILLVLFPCTVCAGRSFVYKLVTQKTGATERG